MGPWPGKATPTGCYALEHAAGTLLIDLPPFVSRLDLLTSAMTAAALFGGPLGIGDATRAEPRPALEQRASVGSPGRSSSRSRSSSVT